MKCQVFQTFNISVSLLMRMFCLIDIIRKIDRMNLKGDFKMVPDFKKKIILLTLINLDQRHVAHFRIS